MKKIQRTYDVKLNLNESQFHHLETRFDALYRLYRKIYKELEKRVFRIHQQRAYRSGDAVRKDGVFHRRYVYVG